MWVHLSPWQEHPPCAAIAAPKEEEFHNPLLFHLAEFGGWRHISECLFLPSQCYYCSGRKALQFSSLANGLAGSALSSAASHQTSSALPKQELEQLTPPRCLSQHLYPLWLYKPFLQLCWQLQNLIACLMILGGVFNETCSSWGTKESQGWYKPIKSSNCSCNLRTLSKKILKDGNVKVNKRTLFLPLAFFCVRKGSQGFQTNDMGGLSHTYKASA